MIDARYDTWRRAVPPLVLKLSDRGAFIVGGQAALYAKGADAPDPARDWDLFVPYSCWRRAAMLIPRTAILNGNRGLRLTDPRLDVWPDDLQRYLEEAALQETHLDGKKRPGPHYVVSLSSGLVVEARKAEIHE